MWACSCFSRSCGYFFRELSTGIYLYVRSLMIQAGTNGFLKILMNIWFFQAHVFSSESGDCAAFLANYDTKSATRVMFNNMHYNLPPWSISILPDCRNAVFNTAKVCVKWNSEFFCILQCRVFSISAYMDIIIVFTITICRSEFKHPKWKCCQVVAKCSPGKLSMRIWQL